MKNTSIISFVIIIGILLFSCGGNSNSKSDSDKDSTNTENTVRIAPKDRLLPDMTDVSKPVPAAKLHEAFYEWTGTEVIVAGYAKMYGSSETLGKEVLLRESTESFDILFNCQFDKDLKKEVKADDILVIKGKITENSYWGIILSECELVSINGKYKKGQSPDPYSSQTEAYWSKDLFDSYNSWLGKEITVIGHYNSTTTSTIDGNSTFRVDLDDPETGLKLIGCTMKSEPDSDKLAANRDNIKIRGKITRDLWGTVQLEECVIVE
jgi:hypothetical protein